MTRALRLLPIACWSCVAGASPPAAPVAAMASAMRRDPAAIRTLAPETPLLARYLDRVAAGDPAALALAPRLRPLISGNAAAMESLEIAVGRAIPTAPAAVVALLRQGFDARRVCTSPFIEPPPGVGEEYRRRAIAALRRLPTGSSRDRCLAGVGAPIKR